MTTKPRPHIDLVELFKNQADPKLEIGNAHLEATMSKFLTNIGKYKNRTIAFIIERRKEHAAQKKRLNEKIVQLEGSTNKCKADEIKLLADLEREKNEKREAETTVAGYRRQLGSLTERCDSLDAEIERYAAIADNLVRERAKERKMLESHAAHVATQVELLEDLLKCYIEGIGGPRVLFRFTHIDMELPKAEFSFVVDVSGEGFKVLVPSHAVPTLSVLVAELNASMDLYSFVRKMRAAFVELCGNA